MTTSQMLLSEILTVSGVSQTEVAARLGVSPETVSRWTRGVSAMPADLLIAAAEVTGMRLTLGLKAADDALVKLVHSNLDVGPTRRMHSMLGDRWSKCRDGLRAAAAIGDRGVVVGPIAAALCGAPITPQTRVDVLVAEQDREDVSHELERMGATLRDTHAGGARGSRDVWAFETGMLTVGSLELALEDAKVAAIRERAFVTYLNADIEPGAAVRVPAIEDLVRLVSASPWAEDLDCRAGLSAVLASGRYRTRADDPGELVLL